MGGNAQGITAQVLIKDGRALTYDVYMWGLLIYLSYLNSSIWPN